MAKQGIWTPWAMILCYGCHGFDFPRIEKVDDGSYKQVTHTISEFEQKRVMKDLPLEDGQAITKCDKCGCEVRLARSIAVEHNLALRLREFGVDSYMAQTGGMNSACSVARKWPEPVSDEVADPEYLIMYDLDGDGKFSISRFDPDTVYDESFDVMVDTFDEALKVILELDDIKYIEGVVN